MYNSTQYLITEPKRLRSLGLYSLCIWFLLISPTIWPVTAHLCFNLTKEYIHTEALLTPSGQRKMLLISANVLELMISGRKLSYE